MNKINNPTRDQWAKLLQRPTQSVKEIEPVVEQVFKAIQEHKDIAVKEYTQKFDKVKIDNILVDKQEINKACQQVDDKLKQAITQAKNNIEAFHKAQRTNPVRLNTTEGVHCWQEKRPIESVGLYIPGGSAPLFSTILMLAIPAKIAGCKQIVLCTPPNQEGSIPDVVLYTAFVCGIDCICKVGGIQAVAGMTFGTDSIPKVSKIFGPGNQYVTVAKQLATKYGIAIDMPAGPSELLVMADETANPSFIAADLLSQAEHGKDSQVIMVTTSEKLLDEVSLEVEQQIEFLERKEIAQKAIENSKLIYVENDQTAIDLINTYAPEHYILCITNESLYLDKLTNAGSVFIGNYTPESAGDYASGTNHTLPTNGYAKQYSGVNLDSFLKAITFQKISSKGIQNIGNTIELMAEAEGLQAHKNAVSLRLKELEK